VHCQDIQMHFIKLTGNRQVTGITFLHWVESDEIIYYEKQMQQ